ncbi:hypothetical protein AAMO2058_000318800 [Amorphochlora amoebiformis]
MEIKSKSSLRTSEAIFTASSACCGAGPPVEADYKERGTYEKLRARNSEFRAYISGSVKPSKRVNCIILVYDIFGWNKKNRNVFKVADYLADNGFFVVMPDFYRGEPWSLDRFPPKEAKDKKDFGEWWGKKCDLKTTDADIKQAVIPFIRRFSKGVKMASIGLLGFCWGGLMCFGCAGLDKAFTYSAIGTIHGARLTPEMAEKIRCPAMVLPSKDDPGYEEIKKVLDKKKFGKHCVYHNFKGEIHGFCAARGDWKNKDTKSAVDKALNMTIKFFGKMEDYE